MAQQVLNLFYLASVMPNEMNERYHMTLKAVKKMPPGGAPSSKLVLFTIFKIINLVCAQV